MRDCTNLPELRQNVAAASKRSRSLVEEVERLSALTGLGDDNTVLDLVLSALDDEKKARDALAEC